MDQWDYNAVTVEHPPPTTRYWGSKYKLNDFIRGSLGELRFGSVLDAFGGTATVSHLFKRMGKRVHCNDVLQSNAMIGKAIVENDSVTLDGKDIESILRIPEEHPTFIADSFEGLYFTDAENVWLDGVLQNIRDIGDPYKGSLAYTALFNSCLAKRPFSSFHRANLDYRLADVPRTFGSRTTWETPFPEMFRRYAAEANRAVFGNGQDCVSTCMDVMSLPTGYDLVYLDPPYMGDRGQSLDYMEHYHFLEGMTDYFGWADRIETRLKTKRIVDGRCRDFTDGRKAEKVFERMVGRFSDSAIAISYRTDGIPAVDTIKDILGSYKETVSCRTTDYKYQLSKVRTCEVVVTGRRRVCTGRVLYLSNTFS